MIIAATGPELTFIRNVHTSREPGSVGAEHTPPSEQGRREESAAAAYIREHMGQSAVILFRSPFTSRSRTTAIGIAQELDAAALTPPLVHELFVDPEDKAAIDPSMDPEAVAAAELRAVKVFKHYLDSLREQTQGTFPVVVMSGLAILQYFAGKQEFSREDVNDIVPTGAVIHEGIHRFKGFVPWGYKAEPLAEYLERLRAEKRAANR